MLGVKQQPASVAIYGDAGRYPLLVKQQTHWRLLTLLVKQIGDFTSIRSYYHDYFEQNTATLGNS